MALNLIIANLFGCVQKPEESTTSPSNTTSLDDVAHEHRVNYVLSRLEESSWGGNSRRLRPPPGPSWRERSWSEDVVSDRRTGGRVPRQRSTSLHIEIGRPPDEYINVSASVLKGGGGAVLDDKSRCVVAQPPPPPDSASTFDLFATLTSDEVRKFLTCPITRETFVDPVLTFDGFTVSGALVHLPGFSLNASVFNTPLPLSVSLSLPIPPPPLSLSLFPPQYERHAIEKWFDKKLTSPITGKELSTREVWTNRVILKLVTGEKEFLPKGMHLFSGPNMYHDPLSKALFVDPVLCVGDGFTYERETFLKHLLFRGAVDVQAGGSAGNKEGGAGVRRSWSYSPVTGERLSPEMFLPNFVFRSLMNAVKDGSIKKHKEIDSW